MWQDAARRLGFEVWVDFGLHIHHYKDRIDLLRVNGLMVEAAQKTMKRIADIAAQRRNAGEGAEEILDSLIESQGA